MFKASSSRDSYSARFGVERIRLLDFGSPHARPGTSIQLMTAAMAALKRPQRKMGLEGLHAAWCTEGGWSRSLAKRFDFQPLSESHRDALLGPTGAFRSIGQKAPLRVIADLRKMPLSNSTGASKSGLTYFCGASFITHKGCRIGHATFGQLRSPPKTRARAKASSVHASRA